MSLFTELGLKPELATAVANLGFTQPTPIQEQAIPILLAAESDFVGLARTGTGKTAAFGLPLLHHIDLAGRAPQAIVLCPTRELCLQITEDMKTFAKQLRGLQITPVYGGSSISLQIKDLRSGTHIVVGTPGRVLDLIERGALKLGDVRFAVLDEADEMLDMGFRDDLDTILAETPAEKRTWLFSATMPDGVSRILKKYMHEPQTVRVQGAQRGDGQINHFHCIVHARDRYAALRRLVDANPGVYGIVFCRTRAETQEVADHLIRDGYAADALHGDLSQAQRDHVMKRFRSKTIQLLVATDVAARGIDVDEITHVFHYQLPDEPESYTHRSGRTGRAGRSGSSIILLHMKETGKLRQLERIVGKAIPHLPVPSSNDVLQAQLRVFAERLRSTPVDDPILKEHIPVVEELLADLSTSDLLSRLVSMQLGRLIKDYSRAPDLNALVKGASGRGEMREPRESRNEMAGERHTFFISLGRMDNIEAGELLAICCDLLNTNRDHIGRIDLKHNFSFFQTIALNPDDVVKAFQEFTYKGRKIRMNLAETRDMEHTAGKRKSWEEKQGRSGSSNRSYSSKPDRGSKFSSSGRGERKSGESKSWGKSSWGKKSEGSGRGERSKPDSDGGNWRNLMAGKVHSGKKSADGKKKKW